MSDEGGFDIGALVQQAQAMQEQMEAAQEKQAQQTLIGSAGGGKVTIEVSGAGDFKRVNIDRDAVDPDEVELLEELILAALRDATSQISELQESSMGDIDLPDIGGLGGMLGGS